jgi:ZIP family zinc transporter
MGDDSISMENLIFAFSLTLFAGLSTGIGSCMAFFAKRTNTKFLSLALGFSAGIMIYISFVEIFFKGQSMLIQSWGEEQGKIYNVLGFFSGIALIAIIDRLIPGHENPHEEMKIEGMDDSKKQVNFKKLHRVGLVTALAISLHNFPEGLATFFSAMQDPKTGIAIALAIAIHNIPEGIAVSIPIYYATGSRKKAFAYSFLSGISEPLGAVIGYFLLKSLMLESLVGAVFSMIAGIMVFISLDQLLPAARQYGEHHLAVYGMVSGMLVMALSLLLFL